MKGKFAKGYKLKNIYIKKKKGKETVKRRSYNNKIMEITGKDFEMNERKAGKFRSTFLVKNNTALLFSPVQEVVSWALVKGKKGKMEKTGKL